MDKKSKFSKNLPAAILITVLSTSSISPCHAGQDTITTATGQTNILSAPNDWTVLGVAGTQPNNDPTSMVFITQEQDLGFDTSLGNIGTVNLYGHPRSIFVVNNIALQGVINDISAPMIARVTTANGGVPLTSGTAGVAAKTIVYIIQNNLNFTGTELSNIIGISFTAPNSSLQLSADNSTLLAPLNAINPGSSGNGAIIITGINTTFNGSIGTLNPINGIQLRDNASATLNEYASFQAGGVNFDNNTELMVAANKDISFNNGAQINFNGNGILRLQGDHDRQVISNITSNNNNGIIIYEGTAGKTLTLRGDIGNSGSNIGLIDITSGGTLKLSTNSGSEARINTIDMGCEDGTLVLNRLGLYLNNFTHLNNYGTIIISDEGVASGGAATVGINGNILGSNTNPINRIRFINTPGGALVNVVLFAAPVNIYAGNVETDTLGKGIFLFNEGYNIIGTPVGTSPLPLMAIAINNNTTVELQQDVFLSQQIIPGGYEIELPSGAMVRIKGNLTGDIAGVNTVETSTPLPMTNGTVEFINPAPVTLSGNISTLNNVNILGDQVQVAGNIETQNLNFNSDKSLSFIGNKDRTLETSNINANNIGAITANDITTGKSLTIIGNVGNPANKLRLIEAKGGGAVIFQSPDSNSRNVSVERINITTNDGSVEFNGGEHSGFILEHDNNAGTMVINSGTQGSFTQFNNGISLSSNVNRLKKLLFRAPVGAPFNVLAFPNQVELYIDRIETTTHDTGVLLFGDGNNLIDAPIGTNSASLHAIALFQPNVSLEVRQDAYVGGMALYAEGCVMKINGNVYTNNNVFLGGGISGIDFADGFTVIKGVKGTAQFINIDPVTFDGEVGYLNMVQIAGNDVTIRGAAEAREFNFSSVIPSTLKLQGKATIHTNGAITSGNNLHDIVFENDVDMNADIGSVNSKFNNITFASDLTKTAYIRSNIYTNTITANNSALSIQNNTVINGDINGINTNLDFMDNQLIYEGNATLTGNAVFTTNFFVEQNGNYRGGGLVLVGNNSSVDFSSANTKVILKANSPTPSAASPYSFTLFDQNAGQISTTSITLETQESNRFVAWSYNPTTHLLTGTRNVTLVSDVIDAGGDSNSIALAQGLSEAEIGAALAALNAFGSTSRAEAVEAIKRLTPLDVSGTALIEAAGLAEKNNTRRIGNQLIEVFGNNPGVVAAGEEIENRYGAWVSPFYSKATQKSFSREVGYKTKSYGGTIGADTMFNDHLSLGVSLSTIHTNVNYADVKGPGKGKSDSKLLSIYGFNRFTPEIFVQGIGFVGFSKLKNVQQRNITANLKLNAHAKYHSISYGTQLLVGKQYTLIESTTLTPMLGLRYIHARDKAYKETGASIQNLRVGKRVNDSLEGILGSKLFISAQTGDFIIRPELQAFVNYNIKNKPTSVDVNIDGFVKPVRIKSSKLSKAWYSLGTGISFISRNMLYGIHYEAELDKKYIGHQGTLRVKVSF